MAASPVTSRSDPITGPESPEKMRRLHLPMPAHWLGKVIRTPQQRFLFVLSLGWWYLEIAWSLLMFHSKQSKRQRSWTGCHPSQNLVSALDQHAAQLNGTRFLEDLDAQYGMPGRASGSSQVGSFGSVEVLEWGTLCPGLYKLCS